MRSRHLPMTWEAFELMPRKLGWKHEYWDGQAHISPSWQSVMVTCSVQPRPVQAACTIRPVAASDESHLITAYIEAFRDTFDFCDWELDKIRTAARDDIRKLLSGQRRPLLTASRVAGETRAEAGATKLIGAALITEGGEEPPLLDILFVVPHWCGKGIATALVSAACNELQATRVKTLDSRYLLGNEESRAWHQKFGFTEKPDLLLARTYYYLSRLTTSFT
jgi:GNAT superfamily N-acetyltransferase